MLYRIEYTAAGSCLRLVWDRQTRKDAAKIVKDVLRQPRDVVVSVCDAPRSYAEYDAGLRAWYVFRHGNGVYRYTGRNFRTLSGALNMLDRLAETEVRA